MAAFSSSSFHHHHPFLLDSVFLPNSPSTTDNKNQLPNAQNLVSMENSSSIVTDNYDSKKRKCKEASSSNSAQSKDKREVKGKKHKKIKNDEEKKNKSKEERKGEEVGYIHVRARRGQATDSHSLAERVRRERISERMKLLQSLVPGCDKVTGKALMLDEIINYVQSLQYQVEFLSMKLASVNPMFYDFGIDLESFMVRPSQDLTELPSPMESMQECSPKTCNNYHIPDNNSANSILSQQAQLPNVLQGSRQTLWEVDDHTQTIINQSEFNSSLFLFH